ncbi:hypothetical protein J2Z21_009831 [Streptomyces griseochromogenes]|uniref:HTH HARE-type domain-containing protein n=2 Tax=Streptomyces griseochromogenes TaxID=68214 RepID=A0ABS4MAV1_9ACTN|nr:hypothetical protein [Streptomyces griseochromogenes]MBP2056812.1 hypothetical protein [Streptomyces griseochromogenes]
MAGVPYDVWRCADVLAVRGGLMVSGEAVAVEGLRTAVDFYADKAARLRQQRVDLEKELAQVDADLASASASHDHLAAALEEITAGAEAGPEAPGDRPGDEDAEAQGPASDENGATGSADSPQQGATTPRNLQLGQQVLQVLATAGRPLRVKEITEAIGRPVSGKQGAAAIETTRKTCKRHVSQGRAVEPEPGVFAIASAGSGHVKGAA